MAKKTIGALVAGLLLGACSTDDALPQIDVEDAPKVIAAQRVGSLMAEFKYPRAVFFEAEDSLRIHAQFLDARGVAVETALEALEMWTPDGSLDLEACRLRSVPWARTANGFEEIRLHLLDVGPITVDGPGRIIDLEARRLPDLLSAFSGVIYGTDEGYDVAHSQLEFYPGSSYRFSAPGRSETGGFSVDMIAPQPLQIVQIGRQDVGEQLDFVLERDADLEISWLGHEDQASHDVYIDLSAGFGPDRARLQCRADDDGHFTIPALVVDQLLDEAGTLQLSMRRIHSTEVDVDGLDVSEFIIATTDEITLILR